MIFAYIIHKAFHKALSSIQGRAMSDSAFLVKMPISGRVTFDIEGIARYYAC